MADPSVAAATVATTTIPINTFISRAPSPLSSVLSDVASLSFPDDRLRGVTPNNKILMVPIVASVRQLYRSVIASYADALDKFISGNRDSATLRYQCRAFISSILKVGFHQDLVNEEAMSQISSGSVSPIQQANWDKCVCPKLRFLHAVITQFGALKPQDGDVGVGVLACGKNVLQLVRTFLRGTSVSFCELGMDGLVRTEHGEPATTAGTDVHHTRISVLDGDRLTWLPPHISLVISLNYDFQAEAHAIRSLNREWERRYPDVPPPTIISLVPSHSGEHIARCIPTNVDELVALRSFASSIAHYRTKAGLVPNIYPNVDELAQLVVDYLIPSDADANPTAGLANEAINPFEEYPQLPVIEVFKPDTGSVVPTDATAMPASAESRIPNSSLKRPLSPGLGTLTTPLSTKRPRLFPGQSIEWDQPWRRSQEIPPILTAGMDDGDNDGNGDYDINAITIANTTGNTPPESSTRQESMLLFSRISELTGCLESVQDAFETRTQLYRQMKRDRRLLENKYEEGRTKWQLTRERLVARTAELSRVQQDLANLRRRVATGEVPLLPSMEGLAAASGLETGINDSNNISPALLQASSQVEQFRQASLLAQSEMDNALARLRIRNEELDTIRSVYQAMAARNRTLGQEKDALEIKVSAMNRKLVGQANAAAAMDEPEDPESLLPMSLPSLLLPMSVTSPEPLMSDIAGDVSGGIINVPDRVHGGVSGSGSGTDIATILPSNPNPLAINQSARLSAAHSEISQLRAQTTSLEQLVRSKDEEMRRLMTRIGPRASARASTPRSPRLLRVGLGGAAATGAGNGGDVGIGGSGGGGNGNGNGSGGGNSISNGGGNGNGLMLGSSRAGSPIGRVGVVKGL